MKALGMQPFQARRLGADLILVFQSIKGLVDVEANVWFNLVGPNILRRTKTIIFHSKKSGFILDDLE